MLASKKLLCLFTSSVLIASTLLAQGHYKNFKVSVYCRAYEVDKMKDTAGHLKQIWDELSRQLKVDKVYLETHRDLLIVDQSTLSIALVKDFNTGDSTLVSISKPILIPQIQYLTNDSWEVVSGIDGPNDWPILHEADYSKGKFYVLAIPDNFADLYNLPPQALNRIREVLGGGMKMHLEGPGNISLFAYDNNTFIVESFLAESTEAKIVLPGSIKTIVDINSNEKNTSHCSGTTLWLDRT